MASDRQYDRVLNVDDYIEAAMDTLRVAEGFRGRPYQDTVGVWTVGYGFNLEARPMPEMIAEVWLAYILFELDEQMDEEFSWWANLDPQRKSALLDMAYNLGFGGFKKFKRTIKHIENEEWGQAAQSILNSKAARQHKEWGNPRYEYIAAKIRGDNDDG